MVAIACIGVAVGARHMEHARSTERGEAVGRRLAAVSSARVGARPR